MTSNRAMERTVDGSATNFEMTSPRSPQRCALPSAVAHLVLVRRMRPLLALALLLSACETTWQEGASITSSSGQRLCAKHRVPLLTIRVYEYLDKPGFVTLVHDASHPYGGIAAEYCPNIIPEHVVKHPLGRMRKPTTVAYCPLCEKEFHERLRVPNEKAALEFAQYVLPIWGGGGVATRQPYQISLRGDVWTVSCFLVDGRKATIKFSKEQGNVISTKYGKRNSSNQAPQPTAQMTL
jgi:hypothetical protein